MILPNADAAEISESKVLQYLLNLEHRDGRGKAIFFQEFGFSVSAWQILIQALKEHARVHPVSETGSNDFGVKYTVDGELETPNGERPNIRVIWFVATDEAVPRLVTAHPLARSLKVE